MTDNTTATEDRGLETLADLADASPIKTRDAEVDFRVNPTELRVDGRTFHMGILTDEDRPARGLSILNFRTGPYQVDVKRDGRKRGRTLYTIDVSDSE